MTYIRQLTIILSICLLYCTLIITLQPGFHPTIFSINKLIHLYITDCICYNMFRDKESDRKERIHRMTQQEHIKQWIDMNLLTPKAAMNITQQSRAAFNQSVSTGQIKPYITKDTIRLFLKSDMEEYARIKRRR